MVTLWLLAPLVLDGTSNQYRSVQSTSGPLAVALGSVESTSDPFAVALEYSVVDSLLNVGAGG